MHILFIFLKHFKNTFCILSFLQFSFCCFIVASSMGFCGLSGNLRYCIETVVLIIKLLPPGRSIILHRVSQKNVGHLVFYNVKTPEPIFIIFGVQYLDNPGLKALCFISNQHALACGAGYYFTISVSISVRHSRCHNRYWKETVLGVIRASHPKWRGYKNAPIILGPY